MKNAKPEGIPALPKLIKPINQKEYKMSTAMKISAERSKEHPKPISLNSPVKYEYHGD
jgi:hypothetical protein